MAKSAPKHFFSQNPSVNQQRTLFDMSKTDTVTLNTDYYYPNYCQLICPGDTVVLDYSNMIRMVDSLQVPMMDNLYCDTHWWFVAFDNVWDYTKNFFGEKKRPSDPDIQTLPLIEFDSTDSDKPFPTTGSVYDYFGIPVVDTDGLLSSGSFSINALPLMSYYLIHDDWIRDEQRVDYLLDTPDFKATTFDSSFFTLYKRGKRFDYFTSTLLNPTGGAAPTTISVGDLAPVHALFGSFGANDYRPIVTSPYVNGNTNYFNSYQTYSGKVLGSGAPGITPNISSDSFSGYLYDLKSNSTYGTNTYSYDRSKAGASGMGTTGDTYNFTPNNLWADLRSATSVSVEQLRRAFQVQAYNELLAKGGDRYTEYLYTMYGVINPDQQLERPEFLGSTHQRLSVQPISSTATTTSGPLGTLGAIVSGGISKPVFTRSFTKFGYIIGCINIYADLTYFQGLEKNWKLRDRMDFPLNIFANLTDQPVYKDEIVLTGTSSDSEVFGYQEIYAWAKYAQNTLRGLVRPNVSSSIGYWSLGEKFTSVPVNDDTFIESNTPIDRITAVNTSSSVHHFICNQKFDVKLTRELPMHSDTMKWMFRA